MKPKINDKMPKYVLIGLTCISGLLLVLSLTTIIPDMPTSANNSEKTDSTFQFIDYPKQAYENVRFGAIKPDGWLKTRMQTDLDGFIGHLDELAPAVITKDDIYGKDRRTNVHQGTEVSPNALAWWNSESQSNWWDGLIRTAVLVNDPAYLSQIKTYIKNKLKTQDKDGYLGIYAKDLRYLKEGENADFWAQASLLRGLLAWYQYSENPELLTHIEKAVQRSMEAYPINKSTPYKKLEVGHSLIFTDILDKLYQITGETKYLDYASFLYNDYNQFRDIPENTLAPDILLKNIEDPNYKLQGHGVHAYELFRSLVTAYYATGNPELKEAMNNYLHKIATEESPSGGPAGDEWIAGRTADATNVGYEYCSLQELLDSYTFLYQKNGNPHLGDKIEWLLFNAGQGARLNDGTGIAYCKTDNSYSMMGPLKDDSTQNPKELRYKYSPVHQDVAVCCAPNAGRIYPYYVQSMWLKNKSGFLVSLYGPNTLTTKFNGKPLKITEVTQYPFENSIDFTINTDTSVFMSLSFRKPEWAEKMIINGKTVPPSEIENGIYTLQKTWKDGDNISLEFPAAVKVMKDAKGERYFAHGSLAYAAPISSEKEIYKKYSLSEFQDKFFKPTGKTPKYKYQKSSEISFKKLSAEDPWKSSEINVQLWNPKSQKIEKVALYPMGGTILRQLTFPIKK